MSSKKKAGKRKPRVTGITFNLDEKGISLDSVQVEGDSDDPYAMMMAAAKAIGLKTN